MKNTNKRILGIALGVCACMTAFFWLFEAVILQTGTKVEDHYITNCDFSTAISTEMATAISAEVSAISTQTTVVRMPNNQAASAGTAVCATLVGGADPRIQECLTLINNERVKAGLKPYVWDETLAKAAQIRAKELQSSWSHTRPDGSQYYTVCDAVMAENLADGYDDDTAENFYTAWMLSNSHKINLMEGRLGKIGMATYTVNGHTYWAQEFGY